MTQPHDNPPTDDLLIQIEENLARTEIDWEPEEVGEQVVGRIAFIEYIDTKNGEMPILAIDTKDGTRVRVWCGRNRLRKQLARTKVQPGDALGIRYEGMKEPKSGGNAYFDYRVDVIRVGERKPDEMFRDTDDDDFVPAAKQSSSIQTDEVENVWTDEDEGGPGF